jgi:hypothetical protein
MDRDLLPKDSVKKLGLFKINLLPKKTPSIRNLLSNYIGFSVLKIDKTLDN